MATSRVPRQSGKYRALTALSLRQSPDPKSPLYEQWFDWAEGEEFAPPEHMKIDLALQRGVVEEVSSG